MSPLREACPIGTLPLLPHPLLRCRALLASIRNCFWSLWSLFAAFLPPLRAGPGSAGGRRPTDTQLVDEGACAARLRGPSSFPGQAAQPCSKPRAWQRRRCCRRRPAGPLAREAGAKRQEDFLKMWGWQWRAGPSCVAHTPAWGGPYTPAWGGPHTPAWGGPHRGILTLVSAPPLGRVLRLVQTPQSCWRICRLLPLTGGDLSVLPLVPCSAPAHGCVWEGGRSGREGGDGQ